MKHSAIAILLVLLAACGGGDAQPGDESFIGPPDCTNPEVCR